jgi:meiotically up-regulated gene 157 (Mug157) protein
MTWTGFRPSDDECQYGYLIPANIFAAGALERTIALNQRVWHSDTLDQKATKLLREIEEGIRQHGVIKTKDTGESIYAYEVDGMGNTLADFDDANVPSLLSIPLLGWTGFDREIYKNTRNRLLSKTNPYYFSGKLLTGIGSPHTPSQMVWPMALAIEALTTEGSEKEVAKSFVFQLRQSMASACDDAMHESVNVDHCSFTRAWFEWANALFVVLVESALGIRCDSFGLQQARDAIAAKASATQRTNFYNNKYNNNYTLSDFYQGIEAMVPHAQVPVASRRLRATKPWPRGAFELLKNALLGSSGRAS